jgi:uncharacterized membrane protein
LLPAVFLFFYTRKSVKATCQGQKGETAPGATERPATRGTLPVSVAILGGWQAMGVFAVFAALLQRMTFFFGVLVHGLAAILILFLISLLSGYSAWAIFRRRLIGWQIALLLAGFGFANMLVTYLRRPDFVQIMREMGYRGPSLSVFEQFPQVLSFILVASLVMITVYLVLILYTRRYFQQDLPA